MKSISIRSCQSWHKTNVEFSFDDDEVNIKIIDEKKKDKKGNLQVFGIRIKRDDFEWLIKSIPDNPTPPAST
jgi:hypothetical protein